MLVLNFLFLPAVQRAALQRIFSSITFKFFHIVARFLTDLGLYLSRLGNYGKPFRFGQKTLNG